MARARYFSIQLTEGDVDARDGGRGGPGRLKSVIEEDVRLENGKHAVLFEAAKGEGVVAGDAPCLEGYSSRARVWGPTGGDKRDEDPSMVRGVDLHVGFLDLLQEVKVG